MYIYRLCIDFFLYIDKLDAKITDFVINILFNIITEPVVISSVEVLTFLNISNIFISETIEKIFSSLYFGFLNLLPGSKISWDHTLANVFADIAYQSPTHDAFIKFCNKSALSSRKLIRKPRNNDVFFEAFWFLNPNIYHTSFKIPAEINHYLSIFSAIFCVGMFFYILFFTLLFAAGFLVYVINFVFFEGDVATEQYASSAEFLAECEKELGSVDDMLIGVILIIVYSMFFFLTWLTFSPFFSNWFLALFVCMSILVFFVLLIPTQFLFDLGALFVFFLRGAGNTTLMFLEFCFDLLAVLIISIRLVIQNTRFILILVAYVELYEFVVDNFFLTDPNYNFLYDFYSGLMKTSNLTNFIYFIYVSFPAFIFQGLYLFFHLLYTIISNYMIYLIIVFWFFSFLYTMFFYERPENHFRFKRF